MKQETQNSLEKMIVNGNRLELPQNEQLSNYPQIKKVLTTAGGKYKKCGFEYAEPAQNIIDRLLSGEVVNDKKKFQFFATPTNLANDMVDQADITSQCRVLEPSAGDGNLADVIRERGASECVAVELMEQNACILKGKGHNVFQHDFLDLSKEQLGEFDKILANPPFQNNADIDHIKHMFSLLKPGGRLISVASSSWTFGRQNKQLKFKEWLKEQNADVQVLKENTVVPV